MGEGLKFLDTKKMMFITRSVSLSVKREVHKRVVPPMVTYGPET